jgi:hypothetical protein
VGDRRFERHAKYVSGGVLGADAHPAGAGDLLSHIADPLNWKGPLTLDRDAIRGFETSTPSLAFRRQEDSGKWGTRSSLTEPELRRVGRYQIEGAHLPERAGLGGAFAA